MVVMRSSEVIASSSAAFHAVLAPTVKKASGTQIAAAIRIMKPAGRVGEVAYRQPFSLNRLPGNAT